MSCAQIRKEPKQSAAADLSKNQDIEVHEEESKERQDKTNKLKKASKKSKGTDIPIDNWWYFLWYINYYKEEINKDDDVSKINHPENFGNFITELLLYKVNNLLRRGLEKDYIPVSEKIPGIKGKLLFNPSIKSGALFTNQAICQFDEYTPNIISNQLIKSTLYKLLIKHNTDKELAKKIKSNFYKLGGIDLIDISEKKFNSVRIHANNLSYRRVLTICKFIFYHMPNEGDGDKYFVKLPEFLSHKIFENYIKTFFENHKKNGAEVNKKGYVNYKWNEYKNTNASYVPIMSTDVNIKSDKNFTIIDCKFGYSGRLKIRKIDKKDDRLTYHTGHLFQLFSYLEAAKAKHIHDNEDVYLQGVLLYAKASNEIENDDDLIYLQSHPVRVVSINLNQHWWKIEEDLGYLNENIYDNFKEFVEKKKKLI